MKKFVLGSLLVVGASTLLAGCGLIPPVTLTNPLGLEGKKLTSSTLAAAVAPLSTRAAGDGTATATATFADIAALPLTPASINVSMALTSATISSNCAPALAASSVAVTLTNFNVSLTDGEGAAHNLTATIPSATFNVNPTTGAISGLNATALAFSIPNLGTAVAILTTAPTPNTVNITTSISTSPALTGCTIAFTFGAGGGTVAF